MIEGSAQPERIKNLCTSCGICCQGYAFSQGSVGREEVDLLRGLPLNIYKHANETYFAIPCPAHKDNRCTVYETRPKKCVKFKCALLNKVSTGETDLSSALETIRLFRHLIDELKDHAVYREIAGFSPHVNYALVQIGSLIADALDEHLRKEHGKVALLLLSAKRLIDNNFR